MKKSDAHARPQARSVKVEAAPGAYSRVVAWQSREAFLATVAEVAESSPWRAPRRAGFVAVLEALAKFAEHRTGRDVAVSVAKIEKATGLSRSSVFRRLADARDAGLVVTVETGRHLYRAERAAVKAAGRRYIRKASVRALSHAPRTDTPTNPERVGSKPSDSLNHQARKTRTAKTTSNSKTDRKPRTLRVQRLAADVDRRLPWLTKDRHVGALCSVLASAGVEEWTASDVVAAVDAWHAERGWKTLAREASNALGWFSRALHRAIDDGAVSRSAAAQAEREAAVLRAAERAREAAEDEARRVEGVTSAKAVEARSSIREALAAARAKRRSPTQT